MPPGIAVLENFDSTVEAALPRSDVRHVLLASLDELLGFWKGRLVDSAIRKLHKAVPEFCPLKVCPSSFRVETDTHNLWS